MTQRTPRDFLRFRILGIGVLIALGIALRLVRYRADRSLWLDEAFLAKNLITHPLSTLLTEPLEHWQSAPPVYLVASHLSVLLFGPDERALRLVPFVAGIASLPLFWLVATRLLPLGAAFVSLALFVLLDPALYFSAEVKQYSLDVCVALAVLYAGARIIDDPRSPRLVWALGGVGALALLTSFPAVFVLAATIAILILDRWRHADWVAARRLLLAGAACGLVFAAEYVLVLRRTAADRVLHEYWQFAFPPRNPRILAWTGKQLLAFIGDVEGLFLTSSAAVAVVAIGGAYRLWRDRPVALGLLVLPTGLALIASFYRLYPFYGRLLHFSSPAWCMLIGAGLWFLVSGFPREMAGFVTAAVVLIGGPLLAWTWEHTMRPPVREELRPVMEQLQTRVENGDLVYVFAGSEVPFSYYLDTFATRPERSGRLADVEIVWGRTHGRDLIGELLRLPDRRRCWIVFSHAVEQDGLREDALAEVTMHSRGQEIERIEAYGALAVLYDLSRRPSTP